MFRIACRSEVPENPFRAKTHEGRGTVHRIRGLRVFAVPLHNRKTVTEQRRTGMSSAIAFVSEGALPDELTELPGIGVGELLDNVVSPDRNLPCRSGDADLWFAE